jgi:ubiquitin-conjugating enzyme (huntingtin interacting protein 2)
MASHKARRIGKELADIAADTQSNIRAESVGDSITTLKGSFDGPQGTPFEGGVYDINIQIPNEYPFKPPVMKFATKIWHPNISSQTVSICETPNGEEIADYVPRREQSALTRYRPAGRLY